MVSPKFGSYTLSLLFWWGGGGGGGLRSPGDDHIAFTWSIRSLDSCANSYPAAAPSKFLSSTSGSSILFRVLTIFVLL